MNLDDVRQGFGTLWESVAEGWDRLRQSATGALTRFRPHEQSNLPARDEVDDRAYLPGVGWAMLGEDVFEDDRRLVVRLEAPGMDKKEIEVEVVGDTLVVRGEKRFERERTEGRWRVLQCAYGSFHRSVPLPVPVDGDKAKATYRDGVLKVELPKRHPGRSPVRQIPVA
jgi:HSP20 family protein